MRPHRTCGCQTDEPLHSGTGPGPSSPASKLSRLNSRPCWHATGGQETGEKENLTRVMISISHGSPMQAGKQAHLTACVTVPTALPAVPSACWCFGNGLLPGRARPSHHQATHCPAGLA